MTKIVSICFLLLCLPMAFISAQAQSQPGSETRGARLAISPAEQAASSYENSYALLIGQSDYDNGWADLTSIPDELDKLESALEKHDFNVSRVENVTGGQLNAAIANFLDSFGYDDNNRLLIFYAGHGFSQPDSSRGYLVPVDAPLPSDDLKKFRRVSLTMAEIMGDMRKISAKHVMVMFDSCFSGSIFRTRGAVSQGEGIAKLIKEPVRQFLTSGSAGEEVPAVSVFVPSIVDALEFGAADANNDSFTTGSELGIFLQNTFLRYANQTPQAGKINDYELSRGDFIFSHKRSDIKTDEPKRQDVAFRARATELPAWFFKPQSETGFSASAIGETEEIAVLNAIQGVGFQMDAQRWEKSHKAYTAEGRDGAEAGVAEDFSSESITVRMYDQSFGASIHSRGRKSIYTNSELFTESKSALVLNFEKNEGYRRYQYASDAVLEGKPVQSIKISSQGVSYNDMRKYLLSIGFSIVSIDLDLNGRLMTAVLLSWAPSGLSSP